MLGASLVRPHAGIACGLLSTLALAGCATQTKSAVTVSGTTLTIYASQPPGAAGGQTAADVLDAERLALQQTGGTVGKFTVKLVALHGKEITDNARRAVQDSSAIAYLGEIEPGTSQDSVQITNELGLLEVSPTDTAAYLTEAVPVVSGSPATFYPSRSTYHETFARVAPTSAQEATAITAEMHSLGLTKLYVADDGSAYGAAIASEVRAGAAKQGLSLVSGAASADAVFYGGNNPAAATKALDQAAAASGAAKLFAASALYDDAFVARLSAAAQKNLYVSSPGFTSGALSPAGRQFVTAFRSAYGHAPALQAIFGYEAMSAVLAVLKQAGADAASRSTVVSDFRALHNRQSVLGTYSISSGDTTLVPFVFGRPRGGRLVAGAPS
ncbi:MAG TPA: ABC transporter substrate-binding protein [Solirubrobacteraceae bacterium]|jgi:ABC-type branched-subunit amino acid transport system substrate-binding protein|nr:ABC transporter substrate-binding protein [Solirubrobacteraceae bacterium]